MVTPVHFEMKHRLDAVYVQLDRDKITHWLMNFKTGLDIDDCRGGKITMGGGEFAGQPQEIFWSFIIPCLEDIIGDTLNAADEYGRKYPPDTTRQGLDETSELLKAFVNRVAKRMVDIDRRLRGKGFPMQVIPHDPSAMTSRLNQLIDARTASLNEYHISSDDPNNSPFSPAEHDQIARSVETMKVKLSRTDVFSAEQVDLISRKLDEIQDASQRLGRKDWKNYVAAALTGVCTTAALSEEARITLFNAANAAFDWLFAGALTLLS